MTYRVCVLSSSVARGRSARADHLRMGEHARRTPRLPERSTRSPRSAPAVDVVDIATRAVDEGRHVARSLHRSFTNARRFHRSCRPSARLRSTCRRPIFARRSSGTSADPSCVLPPVRREALVDRVGGERPSPPSCRSRAVKLGQPVSGGAEIGGKRPRRRESRTQRAQMTWVTAFSPFPRSFRYVEAPPARDPSTSLPQEASELPTSPPALAGTAAPTVVVVSRWL